MAKLAAAAGPEELIKPLKSAAAAARLKQKPKLFEISALENEDSDLAALFNFTKQGCQI